MPKRATKDHLLPLEHAGILGEVLAFVGPGQFAFVGAVCKSFRAGALSVAAQQRMDYNEAGEDVDVDILPHVFTHEAIFAAPSRVVWAVESGFNLKTDSWRVQHWAGWHANVETLLVLHDICSMQWSESIGRAAAESWSVNKLRWLLDEEQCPQAEDICDYAAVAPSTKALAWLKERGCLVTAKTCARAAVMLTKNAIIALKYLRKAGCEWDERTMSNAAMFGDLQLLQLLQWLHKQGAPWDGEATQEAAGAGHLEAFLWLKNNGCPCDLREVALDAASGGWLNILEWVRDSNEIDWDAALLMSMLETAAVYGHKPVETCKWLRSEGAAWPAVLQFENAAWSAGAVAWCRSEGCDSPLPLEEPLQEV
eukprot:8906-Heterococcus_DN1.PRE.11